MAKVGTRSRSDPTLLLPDLSGEMVLRQLKADEHTRRASVIVLSADITARLLAHLLELGAIQCLRKPFSISEFLLAIEGAADTVKIAPLSSA